MTLPTSRGASVSLQGLSFQYGRAGLFSRRPAPRILHDIDLLVPAGRTIGLVGESGSGKSTIAKLMLGLLAPTQGRALLDGRPLAAMPARARARRIQMVFQDPYSSLNPRRTIAEILTAPLRVHGIGDAAARAASVRRMMDAVGLVPAFAARYPRELSGGQRQRVAIARALMLEPQLLICDEPTSALDVSVQAQILNLLMALQRERGLGYLFISHNLAVVQHIADEIVVLQGGSVVERGRAEQVYFAPAHPYTRQLIGATLAVPELQEMAA
ncbi:MAG: ATP-binding cassette domain-containing protein [Achromobacter sp.]|uniref:ATP-binding cassette domain-containing protein n=1 Tax=Achromobacter sp. TaxID=134375 RepID=UPI003D00A765